MLIIASRQEVLNHISDACVANEGFAALRDFVFGHYWNEDEYVFECDEVETVFAVLLPYLQSEDALGDSMRQARMEELRDALTSEFTSESAVLGLEYDRISDLVRKYEKGHIRAHLLRKSIEGLTPAQIDKGRLWELVTDRMRRARCACGSTGYCDCAHETTPYGTSGGGEI